MAAFDDDEEIDEPEPASHRGHVSVPYVTLSAILIGIGLFLTLIWLFDVNRWCNFVGVPLVAVGFLLFLSPRAGLDRAGAA
jgi:hypothetical protein